jgi:hypothetical protein
MSKSRLLHASAVLTLAASACSSSPDASESTGSARQAITATSCPASIFDTQVPDTAAYPDSSPLEVGVRVKTRGGAQITSVRFYKGPGNDGTHVAHIWSPTGELLSTATFTSETSSGWQTVTLPSPLSTTAGSALIASVYMPQGHFAFTAAGLASGAGPASGPVYAPTGTSEPNGVYMYGAGGGFPAYSYDSANYFVDVVANDTAAPTGASSLHVDTQDASSVTLAWSAGADGAGELTTNARSHKVYRDGALIATLNGTGVTYTDTGLSSGTYSYRVDVDDFCGNVTPGASLPVTIASAPPGGIETILGNATPAVLGVGDGNAVELGVKFRSSIAGNVNAVRVYRTGAGPAFPVSLWKRDGTLLGTSSGAAVTSAGWETVTFSAPIAIVANTTYIASYFAADGYFAYTPNGLASEIANGSHLKAVADCNMGAACDADDSSGGNGVYMYSATTLFPNQSYNASNYFADVVFEAPGAPPTASSIFTTQVPANATFGGGSPVEVGVKLTSSAAGFIDGIRFYRGTAAPADTVVSLWSADGSTRIATATGSGGTGSGWKQVTFATPVAITANTVYVASYWTSDGFFAFDGGGLATSVTNAPLTALASCPVADPSCTTGGNGVYAYGATSSFPASTYNSANYWVDVAYRP